MSFEKSGLRPGPGRPSGWLLLLPALSLLACGVKDIARPEGGVDPSDEADADDTTPLPVRHDASADKPKTTVDAPISAVDAPIGSSSDATTVDAGPDGPIECVPPCGAGMACNNGQCESICQTGQMVCKSGCSDVTTDPANCGQCEMACKPSEYCSKGVCVTGCGQGETKCGQSCVNLASDRANCGVCGKACSGAEDCVTGVCKCTGANKVCDGTCQSLTNNRNNCGMCGNRCTGDLVCRTHDCGCPGTRTQCPNNAQKCVSNPDDCCPSGQSLCGNKCVSLKSDSLNCGTCGKNCPGAQRCNNGTCGCPAAQPHACPGDVCLPADQCCANEMKCGDGSCVLNTACCAGMRRCSNGSCIASGCCPNEKPCGTACIADTPTSCCPTDANACGDTAHKCTAQNKCVCVFTCPNGGKCAADAAGCCDAGQSLCGNVCCGLPKVCVQDMCKDVVVMPDAGDPTD
jgi:hypothetical protein